MKNPLFVVHMKMKMLYLVAALFTVAVSFKPVEGKYKVTLAIYSGVPDPVWTVDYGHESFQMVTKYLQEARDLGMTYQREHMAATLGYKGFLVHESDAKEAELIVGKETKDLQYLLLETMPKGRISDDLLNRIQHGIAESIDMPQEAMGQEVSQAPIAGYAPRLNLRRWNDYSLVRINNNCYNYANDKITNSFAQPGNASGYHLPPAKELTAEVVLAAAKSDGLLQLNVGPNDPVPAAPKHPNCLVALVVAKGEDFHWYRLDHNGFWSQKPGGTNATNLDGKGDLIHDPRKAVNLPNGPDYSFVSFMEIFTNIIDGPAGPHP
ncbi:uncharacterized protein [Montipora foliosa]|uniref:uncharacterized protein n=1 Tax=Montipora foliosa TaxID=591990 RepID=UPI0035F1785F